MYSSYYSKTILFIQLDIFTVFRVVNMVLLFFIQVYFYLAEPRWMRVNKISTFSTSNTHG